MDEAIRQKRIMTATLTNKLGVIESLDRSISQAGVDDTNLETWKLFKTQIVNYNCHHCPPVDNNTGHLFLSLADHRQKVPFPLVTNAHLGKAKCEKM